MVRFSLRSNEETYLHKHCVLEFCMSLIFVAYEPSIKPQGQLEFQFWLNVLKLDHF